MSVTASDWVWRRSPYKGADKVIHLALADSANDMNNFEIWARQSWIADKAGVSRETVCRWLTKAEKDGFIKLMEDNRLAGKPNRYQFLMPNSAVMWDPKKGRGGETVDHTPSEGGVMDDHTRCDEIRQGGVTNDHTETEVVDGTEDTPSSSTAAQLSTDTQSSVGAGSVDDGGTSIDEESVSPSEVPPAVSHPSPITDEVTEAIAILIEEGLDEAEVRKALTTKDKIHGLGSAEWTSTGRGSKRTSYSAEMLAETVRLAAFFAERCDQAGNKAPSWSDKRQLNAMRMLLVTDERPARHIRILIEWTFNDAFWCTNVRAVPKFRERWDQLRGARQRDLNKGKAQAEREGPPVSEDWMARTA